MRIRSAVVYTVLRLLAFLVPFAILVVFFPFFRAQYWLAAVFAALIGLSLSLLFLRRPLDDVTSDLAARRARERTAESDEEVEDAAADRSRPASASAAGPQPDPTAGTSTGSADERPEQERAVGD